MSNSFSELYDILSKILSPDKLELMIEEVKRMSLNDFNLHAWKQKEMEDLVIREGNRISKEEGIEEGIEQGIEQGILQNTIDTIKSMLKKNYDIKEISDITGKSIKEIKEIEKSLNQD